MPNTLLTENDATAAYAKDFSYVQEVSTLERQRAEADDFLNNIMVVVIMLLFAAVLLSVNIQYNLGTLNFTEKNRDYTTLKVLGYNKKEIRAIIIKYCLLTVIAGLIAGIPVGFRVLNIYVNILTTRVFEYSANLKPESLALCLLIVFICSFASISVVSRKTDKLNMVASLKTLE